MDTNMLRLILENHILKIKMKLSELYNEQTLETIAGKLLRVFIYRTVRILCVFVCIVTLTKWKKKRKTTESSNLVWFMWALLSVWYIVADFKNLENV